MDVVTLSRIQFAFTISFHYIFPPMSIGLALMIVIMEGIYLKTKKPEHREMARFWVRIFALTFALGVATGLVQVFAFGNNWAQYSRFIGDVFGSALGAEGIFAFFLEAGFIGLMLFGWDRVKPGVHYFATICVACGAHFSAVWIVIANSWMQTPAGFKIVGEGTQARAVVTDWWKMIFNPSSVDRLVHVILGCWLTGVFVVLSVCAYYFIRKRHRNFAFLSMKVALIVGGITIILQLFSADSTARGVAKYQPEKLAAIEGVYKTRDYTPLTLIGWVDSKEQTVHGIKVPALLSLLTYRNPETAVAGLDNFPKSDWANVPVVFQTYHLMIYMWGAMFLLLVAAIILWFRKKVDRAKWLLWPLVFGVILPPIANIAGWFTAEMGRQPWIVYHLLRTSQGVSKSISSGNVLGSLIMFFVIYTLLFVLFIFLLNQKIQHGPEESEVPEDQIYRNTYQRRTGE